MISIIDPGPGPPGPGPGPDPEPGPEPVFVDQVWSVLLLRPVSPGPRPDQTRTNTSLNSSTYLVQVLF